ncbi:Hypothetical predicted protein, partial [Paramuricea clavata]
MAEDHASKTKIKHRKFSQNNKKQAKHTKDVIQPRLPKTASEVSSNWKALSAVIQTNKEPKKTFKRKRLPNESKEFTNNKSKQMQRLQNVIKSGKDEIWFDDVDPDDLEKVAGVKQKKYSEDDDVHTHTRNEIRQHEVTAQEP